MVSRRAARTLLVLGLILIAAGAGAIAYGTALPGASETAPIPAGWIYYNEVHWAFLAGGTIRGTFQEVNNTPVNVLVYSDADYNAFTSGSNLTALYNVTAPSGTIAMSLPGFNTYHVVFQHAPGYENISQTVTVDLAATGSDPSFTIGGIGAIGIGALFVAVFVRRSRQPDTSAGPLPSRATIQMPPPSAPDTSTSTAGMYRVPPPLPGDDESPPGYPSASPAAAPVSSSTPQGVVGTVVVTVENASGADTTLDLVVNGAPVTSMTVPAGQSSSVTVSARLSSPFGSTVTVEAVLPGGRRARQAVFVGAKGTAPVTLRIG